MAAGKTTALKRISENEKWFGYSFIDLDSKIFEKYGKNHASLGSMIEDKGFDWFREVEKEVLLDCLGLENVWIALGGGTLDQTSMEILSNKDNIKGFFLDTPFDVCLDRILENKKSRPLAKRSVNELEELYEQRVVHYSQFEPLVIS
jgi:shikimate kinase